MNDDFKTVWALDSDEVGLALAVMLAVMAIPHIPVAALGYWLGHLIWDVKIIKWGMLLLFVFGWHRLLMRLNETKGIHYSAGLVLLSWLIVDILDAGGHPEKMHVVKWSVSAFQWLFTS